MRASNCIIPPSESYNAKNVIPFQSFSFNLKCHITSARESLCETLRSSERFRVALRALKRQPRCGNDDNAIARVSARNFWLRLGRTYEDSQNKKQNAQRSTTQVAHRTRACSRRHPPFSSLIFPSLPFPSFPFLPFPSLPSPCDPMPCHSMPCHSVPCHAV